MIYLSYVDLYFNYYWIYLSMETLKIELISLDFLQKNSCFQLE